MSIDEIKRNLRERKIVAVAKAVNLHPNCLYRIANGISNPRKETIEVLTQYFGGDKYAK
jgi:hypothetical protein